MPVDLHALYPRLIHLMLDTVFVVDRDNQIVFVSDACEALLGYRASELVGTSITDYMHPDDLAATRASIVRVMNGQPHYDFRNRYIRKDGGVVHILWAASWSDEAQARIGVARDVTAQHQAEQELRFLAHHDPLTRLANRAMFNERLDTALAAARRHNRPLALLFLDINDFKQINDNHGHSVGDRVLCTLARRLEGCVGASGTVARMGGDEFTVLLPDCPSAQAVAEQVQHILAVMDEPLDAELAGIQAPSCSIGVARFPEDGTDADMLLRHADGHMYRIKRQRSAAG
ncbi:sensor domain-containing diguanylate cyclase [Pseudomonas sp. S37]|uniref:sensor domain-containing diguanylate cyclase n=1 Tax=Pseudomonas sp. S37 TaxID=2767449 RepID=UPI001913F875|nr:sensor domain-containing diguanylate cyclase [Pseudomonas sp. S37]MBK4994159.1 sensor domain-containing diguanylate cyclase [Pseudomonas sp. S37]